MQQTTLDRFLRKKYVYVTYVYTNMLPRALPHGVPVDETTEEMGGMYLYRMTAFNDDQLNELAARLEVENITYTSRIADQEGMSDKMFNNANKSFTMQIAWLILIIAILAIIFSGLPVYLWKTLSEKDGAEDGKKGSALIPIVERVERPV